MTEDPLSVSEAAIERAHQILHESDELLAEPINTNYTLEILSNKPK